MSDGDRGVTSTSTDKAGCAAEDEHVASHARMTSAAAAGRVSIAIGISRMLGLVREIVQARYFGAGLASDAFYVAYRVPGLLRDLLGEGALSAAFLPAFTRRLTTEGSESAWLLVNRLLNLLLILVGALTLAFLLGARLFVYIQAAGFAAIAGKLELATLLTRIMAPFLLCVALAAVFMAMLNARGVFFLPALASSIFNIGCILGGIFLSPLMPLWGIEPVVALAIGALVGGLGQLLVMLPSVRNHGFRWRLTPGFADPDLRRIGKMLAPAIVGLSATQINIIIDNQLASSLGDGPVSWLNYAFRLTQLPIGVFGVAIAMVMATDASLYAARRDFSGLYRALAAALRLAACLTVPATVGLMVFRREIVQLLFERNEFRPADTLATAQVLLYYAGALFAYAAIKIIAPAFYALHDSRTPVYVSMLSVAFKIALSLLLVRPLGFLGLAASTTAAAWLNFVLLRRQLNRVPIIVTAGAAAGAHAGKSVGVYGGIVLASLVMGGLARVVFLVSGYVITAIGTTALAARLGLAVMAALLSLLPLLRLCRVPEAGELGEIARKIAMKFSGRLAK